MDRSDSETNWRLVKVQDVQADEKGAIVSGPFGSNIGKRFFVDEGVPVIRGNNLTLGKKRFVDEDFVYITEEKAHQLRNCQAMAGDLVFTAAGTLGQVGLIPEQAKYPRYIISNKQLRLRCDPDIVLPEYLYYWFSAPAMRKYIANQNTGSSIPLITLGTLRNLPVRLPPLSIQRKIASVLSAYDDLIENNTRRIEIIEEMAQAIYREWFVNFRFPGHEKIGMVDSILGPIPEGWKIGRLDDALLLQRGFDLPIKKRQEGSVPIYAATGVAGFHNEAKVQGPGVVTGRSGSLGTVLFVEEDYWPLNTTLWVKEFRLATPLYAFYLLRDLGLESFNSGAAVPTLNRNDVHGLPVVLPANTLLEQFDQHVAPLYRLKRNLRRRIDNLRRTRDLLLPKLISGEVDVEGIEADVVEGDSRESEYVSTQ